MADMTFEEIMNNLPMSEDFEDMVERIARAWHETPCPSEDGFCNPAYHRWHTADAEDKRWARTNVRFVLREAGLG